MDIPEHNKSADPNSVSISNNLMCVDVQTSSLNGLQTKEHGSSGDEFAPKVSEPYTITKQRERWTEEEHKKFLEALQLYGRAWPRIEELIGTKTAVQIRSHAQKFFSKVVRESSSNGTGNVKPIEIPPPRPKRKSVHLYPRKTGNPPSKSGLIMGKLERSSSPILSAYEQENGSPTSVLSAFGSDTVSSFLSNLPNRCTSPVNSAEGSSEQETSGEEENRTPSPGQTNAALTGEKQNHSPMEADLCVEGHASSKESSSADAPVPCLKLFGRTVLVTDSHMPSSPSSGNVVQNSKSLPIVEIERQDKSAYMDMGAPALPILQGALPGDFLSPGKGSWSPWSAGMLPMFYLLPSKYGDSPSPADPRVMSISWWALCGNLPLPYLHQQNSSLTQLIGQPCAEASSNKVVQKECSWSGLNTAFTVSTKCMVIGRSVENGDNAALSGRRTGSDKSGGGFVPYKRCVVEREREGHHPQGMSDGEEGQAIGLCL